MTFRKSLGWAVALGALLLSSPATKADLVSFVTLGSFSGGDNPGSSTYLDAANGITIAFNGSVNNNVNVPPSSSASFGTFDTTGTDAADFVPVTGTFTLSIFQSAPTVANLSFVGTLTGTLRADNSQAYIQFDAPLSQTLGDILYQIVSADGTSPTDHTPGRVNLAPPTTNLGVSTIQGRVGRAVPEPSTLVLMGIGGPALMAIRYRRKMNANVAG